MLKTIGILFVVAVGVPLLVAAVRPDRYSVVRSATIQAPPEKLHALINDLRQYATWDPFGAKDPDLKADYRGPASGPGQVYAFEGRKDVGSGSLAITDSTPSKVTMELHMVKPFEGRNTIEFALQPHGSATQVTWSMYGPLP